MKTEVPILTYHEIIDDGFSDKELLRKMKKSYFVKKSVFDEQMQYLKNEGFSCITLREFIEFSKNSVEAGLPDRCFVITFDDGYLGNHKFALPILKKYDFTATFFITVNFIGTPFMMGWDELKQLVGAGMSVQSHTMTHPFLKQLSDDSVRNELQKSKKILEDRLNIKVEFVSLPHGSLGENYKHIARDSGFLGSCSSNPGLNNEGTDPYFLRRLFIPGELKIQLFKKIVKKNKFLLQSIILRKKNKEILREYLLGEKLYKKIYDFTFQIKDKNIN